MQADSVGLFLYRNFVQAPYREAAYHFHQAEQVTGWGRKITHLAKSAIYAIPVLGAIVLIALRCFRNFNPGPARGGIDRLSYPGDSLDRIESFIRENKMDEAWQLFTETRKKHPHMIPPERLISTIVEKWASYEMILQRIPVELLRDCAMAYDSFREQCLQESKLWKCFRCYPEYIADIAKENSAFAFEVITTEIGDIVNSDDYRMELFRSAYAETLSKIQSGTLSVVQMKHFAYFLFLHSRVVNKDDFARFNKMADILKTNSSLDPKCLQLLDLVIGKMSMQRSYASDDFTFYNWLVFAELFATSRQEFDEGEIGQRLIALKVDENIQKGILFLQCISSDKPGYLSAQMALGNFWLEQEEYLKAGHCFLQAGQVENRVTPTSLSIRQDALTLAALALFVKSKDEQQQWRYEPRGEQNKDTEQKKLLSSDDCKALIANEQEFLTRLRRYDLLPKDL